MTHYIQYGSQALSCFWRADGTLSVRLRRLRHRNEALIVKMGDALLITTKQGACWWVCRVRAFIPHLQYGSFVRSGRVVCENVQCFNDRAIAAYPCAH